MVLVDLFFWGFAATVVLTTIMAISKPMGYTRMDIPFMLGTVFTANRNKAPFYGFITHLIMGWIFALVYGAAFELSGYMTWWFGSTVGFIHALFVLTAGLQLVNYIHPRMARPEQGPTPTKALQPPGFFALNYGKGTPLVTILAHLIYGGILGFFYG